MAHKLKFTAFALAIIVAVFFVAQFAFASLSTRVSTNNAREYNTYTFFTATTTTATSTNLSDGGGYFQIAGAKNVVFYFTHGGVATSSTASSTFKVQTTRDGSTWDDYFKLQSSTSTANVQSFLIVGATTTVVADMGDKELASYLGVRCIVTEGSVGLGGGSGDGEHTCIATGEF